MTDSIHETNVTVDDLAIMIANGFRNVDKRFGSLEERLSGRIDSLDERLTGKIDSLESRVNQMDMRLTSQLDNMALNHVDRQDYTHLEKRVKKLELARA